ncbi:MAG: hypothetical protein NTW21_35375, partial [Verrucomicrobia bacterium]|nr:hypothetical protein [Verrucomicrobiota bacterium]
TSPVGAGNPAYAFCVWSGSPGTSRNSSWVNWQVPDKPHPGLSVPAFTPATALPRHPIPAL